MWWLLLFIPIMLILYHFGIVNSSIGTSIGGNWGTSSWWRGKYAYLSGKLSRNFVTREYTTLHIEIETISGEIDLSIQDSNRNILYAWGYISGLDTNIVVDKNEKYFVQISASNFKGQFFLSLRE